MHFKHLGLQCKPLQPLVTHGSSCSQQREKAKVQAQEDVERQRQDRELQTQQEEEERLQRKKVVLKGETNRCIPITFLLLKYLNEYVEGSQSDWMLTFFCRELRRL